jgi:hypothetical protein
VPIAAAVRAGRSFNRNASTSAIVNLPALRMRSASRNITVRNATRNPIEYRNPSNPYRKIKPAMPRNEAADR